MVRAGKWLPRCLADVRADWPARLVAGQRAVLVDGDRSGLESVVAEILARAGGRLQEGFRADGTPPPRA